MRSRRLLVLRSIQVGILILLEIPFSPCLLEFFFANRVYITAQQDRDGSFFGASVGAVTVGGLL